MIRRRQQQNNNLGVQKVFFLTTLIGVSSAIYKFTTVSHQFSIIVSKSHAFIMNFIMNSISTSGEMPEDAISEYLSKLKIPDNETLGLIENLKIEKKSAYTQAECHTAENLVALQNLFKESFKSVPVMIRDLVIQRTLAISDGILNFKKIERNTVIDMTDSDSTARAFSFFYHFRKLKNNLHYSCILITGIDFKTGEKTKEYEYREETYTEFEEECVEEGVVFKEKICRHIPKERKKTIKIPVLKSSALTLKEADALYGYIIKNAVDNANALIADSKKLGINSDNQKKTGGSLDEDSPKPKPKF